jgi:hypothetical protein
MLWETRDDEEGEMAALMGGLLALAAAGFAAAVGFDRTRTFYPLTLIVIASYYVLFAVMGHANDGLIPELLTFSAFACAAVFAFKGNLWVAVFALIAHAVLDVFHGSVVANPGVPPWWPTFCLTYDVVAAGCLATLVLPATRAHVALELEAAADAQLAGRPEAAFSHLERAHVLAQRSTLEHVRVHWRMLCWSVRQRDLPEGVGQSLRLLAAAVATPFGLAPAGNTGGSGVSPFRPMDVPADLAAMLAAAPPRSAPSLIAAAVRAGAVFGTSA